eukprot:15170524-Alexandrium_andersonii.AAC.1
MCIRDSSSVAAFILLSELLPPAFPPFSSLVPWQLHGAGVCSKRRLGHAFLPVSYTHLTLPTICSV